MMGYSPAKAFPVHAKLELKSPVKPVQPVEEEGDESDQSTETTASPDRVYILASSRTPSPPAIQSWAASPQIALTPRRSLVIAKWAQKTRRFLTLKR